MTLLYVLGTGSTWDDNELRYSLRSVHAHVKPARVVVVGERPAWLQNVLHVAAEDRYPAGVACTLHKLITACADERVPEEFILMNDDFIFLADAGPEIPTYVRGTVQQCVSAGPRRESFYYGLMVKALSALRAQGVHEPLDFEAHRPLQMNKRGIRRMTDRYGGSGSVYAWRTYYGNLIGGETTHAPDVKIYQWQQPLGEFISLGDELPRSAEFLRWITQRFPVASPYELE